MRGWSTPLNPPKHQCVRIQLKKKKSITKKTKLILPVHLGGISCDMKSLKSICKNNSLYLVEDAAHATGTKFNGKTIGQHAFDAINKDVLKQSYFPKEIKNRVNIDTIKNKK